MDEFDVSADWRSLHDNNFPDFGLEFLCEKEDIAGLRPSMGNFKPAQNTKMPVELICSLCNTCINEAVMIPCCQYSFCEKCELSETELFMDVCRDILKPTGVLYDVPLKVVRKFVM
ncbi:E3 ubiquitin ligase PARAQUAT TOLERANCE 3-like [Forsythia ovata]|uniref:E3 ubiquitin ligase PARAQUAT TOLERANCE 3-like n=1 Tax=Forsythia ovata TaxID=205694 RepID=A0ABD1W614_9LAMI